jgi:hypothetical protein
MDDELAAEVLEHDVPINGDLSRRVADDLRVVARKAHHLEVWVVAVAAALVVVTAAASTWNTFKIHDLATNNARGVDRIIDCTTEGQPCYVKQQAAQNLVIADALLQLNEEHIAIECILLTKPGGRVQKDIDDCRAKAKDQTEAARADLRRQLGVTTTTTTGPGHG